MLSVPTEPRQAEHLSLKADLERQLSVTRQLQGDVQGCARELQLAKNEVEHVRAAASAKESQLQADVQSLSTQLAEARRQADHYEQLQRQWEAANVELRQQNAQIQADMQTLAARDIAQGGGRERELSSRLLRALRRCFDMTYVCGVMV